MVQSRLRPDGMQIGAVANSLRKAVGSGAAVAFLQKERAAFIAWDESCCQSTCVQPSCLLAEGGEEGGEGGLAVLCEAPGLVAISKPSGLSSENALELLARRLRRPFSMVSRLDQPTSGVLVFADGRESSVATWWLQALFAGRVVSKEYVCLCIGAPPGGVGAEGEVSSPLRVLVGPSSSRAEVSPLGREACTRYRVLATYRDPGDETAGLLSLLQVQPLTGRTHQIRAHLASIGLPLAGDRTYGSPASEVDSSTLGNSQDRDMEHRTTWCPRLFLH
ncbi:unnamed protein product [Polarella glacialis]|uniref:Pseudouridine synthase RsuA/RluA-like domain-containing protein n=1 Tax=Polarella glacialis TaxID=89957 RepID=A0A813KU55_POLGL|nr:unnamed protein product [Polarella glacialis]